MGEGEVMLTSFPATTPTPQQHYCYSEFQKLDGLPFTPSIMEGPLLCGDWQPPGCLVNQALLIGS